MISATWEVEETAVDNAFFNNLPLDLSKDFFPFGERPRFGDVLYLSCDAFSKPQAKITLKIKLTNPASAGANAPIPPVSKQGQPKIQWEHWDGRRWVTLACQDGTEAFTEDGEIVFLAPSPFPPTAVNGLEGFWIRARLVSGNYGEDERLEFTSQDQGLRRIPVHLSAAVYTVHYRHFFITPSGLSRRSALSPTTTSSLKRSMVRCLFSRFVRPRSLIKPYISVSRFRMTHRNALRIVLLISTSISVAQGRGHLSVMARYMGSPR